MSRKHAMGQRTEVTGQESFQVRDGDDGGAPGAAKRPWSKPAITVLHRLVRIHTGPATNFVNSPEDPSYTARS